jgi:O-succinylbenzoic acid--CoA ligase
VGGPKGLGLERGDVVAVDLPPGPAWLDLAREVWDAGAALFPIDHRLPPVEAAALLRGARPTVLVSADGRGRREDGVPARSDLSLVVHTSGTAGEPKLVEFNHAAVEAAVRSSALALEATAFDPWLCCLPLAHVGGLLVLLRGVLLGAPVAVHPRFDPEAIAAEPDVAFTSVVPTMLVRLLDASIDLGRFRAILVGGARLPSGLRERAEGAGARIVPTYGLTESCGGVVYDGSPLPGTEIRIDALGGIELRGPTLMLGYRFDADGTTRAFTSDGWLRPGDAGEIDAEGRLHVIGRIDGVINTGGEKVWPEEVESVLLEHPGVAEVAVGGRLDPEWGQRVVAWVVPAVPAAPPTLADLRDHVAASLPRHKAPRELVLVETLPRTGAGKVRRASLPEAE